MVNTVNHLVLPKRSRSVVVRPRSDVYVNGSSSQTLIFLKDEIRELQQVYGDNGSQKAFHIGEQRLPVIGNITDVSSAIYDPFTDSIVFVDSFSVIKRLDSQNAIHVVEATCHTRFTRIWAIAADGKGNLFVADQAGLRISVVQLSTGEVISLRGSEPPAGESWIALSYDTAADALVAATRYAVFHVLPYGSHGTGHGLAAATRLIAGGSLSDDEYDDSDDDDVMYGGRSSGDSCFQGITTIVAGAGSCVYVLDGGQTVRTVAPDGSIRTTAALKLCAGATTNMAVLPGGELTMISYKRYAGHERYGLVVLCGGRFVPCSCETLCGSQPAALQTPRWGSTGDADLPSPDSLLRHSAGVASRGQQQACSGMWCRRLSA